MVKKLFNNLAQKNHKTAVKRIQKLRALDTANEFLIQLEELSEYVKMKVYATFQENHQLGKIDTNQFLQVGQHELIYLEALFLNTQFHL